MSRKIIGICGLAGSGKGTVADYLDNHYGMRKISFADKLKDGVACIFDMPRHLLEGDTKESREWREIEDPFWKVTPRYILQRMGTECMRHGFDDLIWVKLVQRTLIENPNIDFVIPDVRFENEIDMIREVGGEIWWIRRGNWPDWAIDYMYSENPSEPEGIHPSEYRWMNRNYDHMIGNDHDIKYLHNEIERLMK